MCFKPGRHGLDLVLEIFQGPELPQHPNDQSHDAQHEDETNGFQPGGELRGDQLT